MGQSIRYHSTLMYVCNANPSATEVDNPDECYARDLNIMLFHCYVSSAFVVSSALCGKNTVNAAVGLINQIDHSIKNQLINCVALLTNLL